MIRRLFDRCIITPDDVKPYQDNFKVVGTFNPGAVELNGTTYFLIRVAEMPKEKDKGNIALPRVENKEIIIDWEKKDNVIILDERAVARKPYNFLRLTNISHLRLAKSRDGINIDSIDDTPALFPEKFYEEYGIEDARITPIGNKFYITYVAISRQGISTALATTEDFINFERHGIIFPTENKDIVIFPEKINGQYIAFHRPLSANPFDLPKIWIAYSYDLVHWGNHDAITSINSKWESMSIGAGTPPIKTEKGWLEIYHGSYKAHSKDTVGIYSAGAALFELDNPYKLLGVSENPILIPETDYETLKQGSTYEKNGFISNIVFPTGIVKKEDELFVYCGAADTYTSVIKLNLQDILSVIN